MQSTWSNYSTLSRLLICFIYRKTIETGHPAAGLYCRVENFMFIKYFLLISWKNFAILIFETDLTKISMLTCYLFKQVLTRFYGAYYVSRAPVYPWTQWDHPNWIVFTSTFHFLFCYFYLQLWRHCFWWINKISCYLKIKICQHLIQGEFGVHRRAFKKN